MIITPTFTFNLKDGWFVGMSDYNFTWNWENNSKVDRSCYCFEARDRPDRLETALFGNRGTT